MSEIAMTQEGELYMCAGGCSQPVHCQGAMCFECNAYARHYGSAECRARLEEIHKRRNARNPVPAARRGVFTFLGWNADGPAKAARLESEGEAAPVAGDAVRRSALMAALPRVQAGVRAYAMNRAELWHSDIPLCTVLALMAWDVARCVWWTVTDAFCVLAARHLCTAKRLRVFAAGAGIVLAAVAGLIAGHISR